MSVILIGDPERLKVHKRKKKPKKDRRRRYETVYSVSLNKFNQGNTNMKLVEKCCHAWQHFYTSSSDGKLSVVFMTAESAIKFYIKARQKCFRPNEPIQFCWRKVKFQKGDYIEFKGYCEKKHAQRMSEFTYR